jgi:DNA-binding LacI/PurR family transcriptional regulator
MKKVTSFDVARLAGVSQPTMSRALRNLPGTSPQTRARVLAAAQELSYVVSDLGRVLSATRTRRVAVVSEELTNPFYPELVEPVRRELARHDLRAVLVTDTDLAGVGIDVLADGSYDGVILTTTARNSTLPRDLTAREMPHVLVNRVLDVAESHSCTADNPAGARAISALLVELGHRDIGTIQGPVATSTGRERAEALRTGLKDHGIALRRELLIRGSFSHDDGFRAGIAMLERPARPSAVVCGNDVIAMGVLSAARHLGLAVPGDLTVIGFDDIPMASWPLIDLTTVRCDLDGLAREAARMLTWEIETPGGEPQVRRVPVELVLRSTHAPPPANHT